MLPSEIKIDFSAYRKNLIEQALSRVLFQFKSSRMLNEFLSAFVEEAQELFDALVDLAEYRTVYQAVASNLDGLGRVVGQARLGYEYSDKTWFASDRIGQGADRLPAWCIYAPLAEYIPARDADYRQMILARAACNHALFASVDELQDLIRLVTGMGISWERTTPMGVRVLIPSNISTTNLMLITRFLTDVRSDRAPSIPYPATINFDDVAIFIPQKFFCADRPGRQACDIAPCAVGAVGSY